MTDTAAPVPVQIRTTSLDEGTVNGRPVQRGQYPTIHAACIALVVPWAQQASQPILAHAIDTTSPQAAEFWINIHPNGDVRDSILPDPQTRETSTDGDDNTERRFGRRPHGGSNKAGEISKRNHTAAHFSAGDPSVATSIVVAAVTGRQATHGSPHSVKSPSISSAEPPSTVPPQPYQPPTLSDLLAHRPAPLAGPAQIGWRAFLRQLTGGLLKLPAGQEELAQRTAIAAVQRSLSGPKTIVVINPKGGADKTTATLLIAATFGIHRGGYTLAWDNNETRGTMGWRAIQGRHTNTAVDLLRELPRFQDTRSARVGDLDNFVRSQGSAQFDVLASDEDAASAASIDAEAFEALHRSLARFYRVIVVDTGNNMRASNWQAAVEAADQLVIVSTVREDTAQSAAWVADALNAAGQGAKVRNAVTVLAAPSPKPDQLLAKRLRDHFTGLTRAVADVPFDPSLVAGGPINVDALTPGSRQAWLRVTALVADGL